MEENEIQTRERLTAVESSLKSEHKRLDHMETVIAKLQEDVKNSQSILVEIKHMREDINKVSEKVDEIEKKPTKLWGTVVTAVLSALAGGLGTFLVTKLIGG